jgi:hypothetical protein
LHFRSIDLNIDSLYRRRYEHVIELSNKMMSVQKKFRPNCYEILMNKSSWALSLEEIRKEDKILSSIWLDQTESESFSKAFLKIKLKIRDELVLRKPRLSFFSFIKNLMPKWIIIDRSKNTVFKTVNSCRRRKLNHLMIVSQS